MSPDDSGEVRRPPDYLVRGFYLAGLAAIGLALLLAIIDTISFFLGEHGPIFTQYEFLRSVSQGLVWIAIACTAVLWLRSWQLVYPKPVFETGISPVIWAAALIFGACITPWFVVHAAIKEGRI